MGCLMIVLCVISAVAAITISPNGNSPEVKMIGGMMVDYGKNYEKLKKLNNSTKLSVNERYRRLIPYMTFYYANDIASTTEPYNNKDVEVEKVQIIEQKMIEPPSHRPQNNKYVLYSPPRNIPRFQGNRFPYFNIASVNPTKVYYNKDGHQVSSYQHSQKPSPSYNPLIQEHEVVNDEVRHIRYVQRPSIKSPSSPFSTTTRKPFLNLYSSEDVGNVQYYYAEKDQAPKYKLVPYEQTPPVKVIPQNENLYVTKKPASVPIIVEKEQTYIKPRPARPQYIYEHVNVEHLVPKKHPVVVSENYYERRQPIPVLSKPNKPLIESGFKPIINPLTTEAPVYTTIVPSAAPQLVTQNSVVTETPSEIPEENYRPTYYQYVVDQPTYKPEPETYVSENSATLSDLLNSLQINKSIPKPITKDNVGSSIRTLLQVLNALKAMQNQNEIETPVLSTPKTFESTVPVEIPVRVPVKPDVEVTPAPAIDDADLHEEPYLADVHTPSQHLDDFPSPGSSSQRFPLQVQSDEEGGTPGRPGVDYPVLTTIPPTRFDCKTQRYKGFFADPETRCQVWHYCDLNGGQASFLCPNGTIFNQAALTCDWWFNVRCASTTQLYVLNESLYKFILPHSPKFPEDYSGPLVDKYLTLKFKEMEEQFKKNKKKTAQEKMDSEDEEQSEDSTERSEPEETEKAGDDVSTVSEASVVVETPGTSGNVERLQD